MNNRKSARINKEKVKRQLKDLNMQQQDLAFSIGIPPESLSRILKDGITSPETLDRIGDCLGVAPEYLSDDSDWLPWLPNDYSIHQIQAGETEWASIVRAVWLRNGYDPRYIDREVYWGMLEALREAADNYIDSVGAKQLRTDAAKIKEDRMEKKLSKEKWDYLSSTSKSRELYNQVATKKKASRCETVKH